MRIHHARSATLGSETVFLIEHAHRRSAWSASTGASPTRPSSATGSASSTGARVSRTEAARAVIDFAFEEFDDEQLSAGARVTNPASRNVLEKCGFQWSGVELHRFRGARLVPPVDCFRLSAACGRR